MGREMNIEYVILIGAGIVAVCNSSGRSNSGRMIRIRYCPSLSLSLSLSALWGVSHWWHKQITVKREVQKLQIIRDVIV